MCTLHKPERKHFSINRIITAGTKNFRVEDKIISQSQSRITKNQEVVTKSGTRPRSYRFFFLTYTSNYEILYKSES